MSLVETPGDVRGAREVGWGRGWWWWWSEGEEEEGRQIVTTLESNRRRAQRWDSVSSLDKRGPHSAGTQEGKVSLDRGSVCVFQLEKYPEPNNAQTL